jgi:hypothetical protein
VRLVVGLRHIGSPTQIRTFLLLAKNGPVAGDSPLCAAAGFGGDLVVTG